MSSEGMDSNPEILEREAEANAMDAAGREWPGVSHQSAPVKFPGEDGGRSLAKMAKRDVDAALQLLAERAQYITGATGAAIALRDGEEMVCRASAGGSAPEIGARLQMDSGLSGESIRTRQMLRCDDAQADDRVNKESCEALGIASVIVMPMMDGGEVLGVFELFSDRAYAFEERDITALERMGAMVRTAIEQEAAGKSADGDGQAVADPVVEMVAAEPDAESPLQAAELMVTKSAAAAAASDWTSTFEDPAAPSFLMQAEEEIEGQVDAGPVTPDSVEVAPAAMAAERTVDPGVAEPVIEEGATEAADDSLFLSVPGKSENAAAAEETAKKIEPAEPDETDIGEIARDAAARTAAFKASLFAQEEPAVTEARPERIAFHMRVPARKIAARRVEDEMPATLASAALGVQAQEWNSPVVERQELAVAEPASADIEKFESKTPANEVIAPVAPSAAPAAPVVAAVTAGGAAAAPALDAPPKTTASATQVSKIPQSAPAPPTPVKPEDPESKKAKNEVSRPASAEGRLRIAVSQVRKCEACGFPVSEGRKLCLDCEKKKTKGEAAGPKAATAVATSAADLSLKTEPVVAASLVAKAEAVAFVVPEPTQPEIDGKVEVPVGAVEGKATVPEKSTAAPAARESVAEPAVPQFMMGSPDHYESWIVSHMYTAVAIAIVAVGIVVYLLSR